MTDPFTAASSTYIAAQKTNQGGGKGWAFVPEEPKTPIVVWQAMAWIAGLGVLFVVLPSLVRMVVA